MPDFLAGPLFGNPRYTVASCTARGLFHQHDCRVAFAALPASGRADEELVAEVKSINYAAFSPDVGETFAQYIARRRAELAREKDLLVSYHDMTAHVPQVFDWLEGDNRTDPDVAAHGLAKGEPALVLRRIQAKPLSALAETVSQEEGLALAEKLLMLLRVFHTPDLRQGVRRYFATLQPDDVLFDRLTRDVWFRNLWKLRAAAELTAAPIPCDPELQAFVSPALWAVLRPVPRAASANPPTVRPPQLDLYSIGAILTYLLSGSPDLTRQPPGSLGPKAARDLRDRRGLSAEVAEFLAGLTDHKFDDAQAALQQLCQLRRRPLPRPYFPPAQPRTLKKFESPMFPDKAVLAGRYRVMLPLVEGGLGCVYIGEDVRTGARVILKVCRYIADDLDALQKRGPDAIKQRREELLHEARLALRMQNRTGAVPQVLDVALTTSPEPAVAGHPKLKGDTEPVLVFEYITGSPLAENLSHAPYEEEELLHLMRSVCGFLSQLHAPDKHGNFHLYVDWKPANIVRHPESGTVTVVDLGAIVEVVNGEYKGALFSTDPFAGPEEYEAGKPREPQHINRRLTAAYDLHGMAAVCWYLAARPDDMTVAKAVETVRGPNPRFPVLDAAKLPPNYKELRPVLEQGLRPDPLQRFRSAEEMAAAVRRAQGKLSPLPPEPVSHLVAKPLADCKIEVTFRVPLDPFCEEITICRDRTAVANRGQGFKHDVKLASTKPGATHTWIDTLDPAWTEVHYAAFTRGFNGQDSEPARCHTHLLLDPEVLPLARGETALTLRWKVPDVAVRNNGTVIVECLTGGKKVIYQGLGTEFTDANLRPGQKYRYRLFCKLPYGDSKGVEIEGEPLPRLAQIKTAECVPGESAVTVRWTMTPDAAHELVFLRSQAPLAPDDLANATKRAPFAPLPFALDRDFHVTGVTKGGTLKREADGLLHGEWVDTTARPGLAYYYTPLLRYRDGNREWVGPAAQGTAFAEAERFDAADLPGALRLTWTLPERAEAVRLERDATPTRPAMAWHPTLDQAAVLDHNLEPGAAVTYRLRLKFGDVWSRGKTLTRKPLAALPPLPAPPAATGEAAGALVARWGDDEQVAWSASGRVKSGRAVVRAVTTNGDVSRGQALVGEGKA